MQCPARPGSPLKSQKHQLIEVDHLWFYLEFPGVFYIYLIPYLLAFSFPCFAFLLLALVTFQVHVAFFAKNLAVFLHTFAFRHHGLANLTFDRIFCFHVYIFSTVSLYVESICRELS